MHFLTDNKLDSIFFNPCLLVTKDVTLMWMVAKPNPKKVTIINLVEMTKIWGKDTN